ncbi:MAG: NAD(P)/FAD-dependent oxidoreductase [Planctomycetia bacterium]|nr:NAD(P)/FAD-dependent oxidoreductase [Planctomycetia bacterium]
MPPKRILVLGGGFAGLWSAVGAARERDRQRLSSDELAITIVNRDAFHSIRVRNYEADLRGVRVPLDDVLEPVDVERVEATVEDIDLGQQAVAVRSAGTEERQTLPYDRLVFALGSRLNRPTIPGLAEYGFDVDTYDAAARLDAHLASLPARPASPGQFTVLVVGAGLTGIETATEMPDRVRAILAKAGLDQPFRVILADHKAWVGSDMGESARPVIEQALASLGIETWTGCSIVSVDEQGATLGSGERIAAATVVWCAGMRAHPLTKRFPVERDCFGRVPVDECLRVVGVPHVFAAGDVARAMMDDTHASVMSCQHGRPMGRFAGHNVVCDLVGQPMLPLRIEWYVTVLDLGAAGAVYTQGWNRAVAATGEAAKKTKRTINCQRIYPPLDGNREAILEAAAPVVQSPPDLRH